MTLTLKAISLIGQNHAYNTSGTTRLFWGDVHMRTKSLVKVSLAFWIIVSAGSLDAQERGPPVSRMPTAASRPPNAYVQPFGVPLAPPVYFVNFLLLYWSNPEVAANMPAYRAALPQQVYECLLENPRAVLTRTWRNILPSRPSPVEESAETRILSGQRLARRTPNGKPLRHVNTEALTRSTSRWGRDTPGDSRGRSALIKR